MKVQYREAIQLDPCITLTDGAYLTPHEVSQAQVAGWLIRRGFTDFLVSGDEPPYSIILYASTGVPEEVKPGDWIVQTLDGVVMSIPQKIYNVFFQPLESYNEY